MKGELTGGCVFGAVRCGAVRRGAVYARGRLSLSPLPLPLHRLPIAHRQRLQRTPVFLRGGACRSKAISIAAPTGNPAARTRRFGDVL